MGKALTQETEIEVLKLQVSSLDKKMDDYDRRNCEQHEEIKAEVGKIGTIVSKAMTEKADKTQVKTIEADVNRLKTEAAVNAWKVGLITGILATIGSVILKYILDNFH
jgi:folate-binding Fe-S cluster repair protein YgfZ